MPQAVKQTLTISLSPQTIFKAKMLAAKRSTSVSALIADQVESLIDVDDAYEAARNSAVSRMERGLRMGTAQLPPREDLHDR